MVGWRKILLRALDWTLNLVGCAGEMIVTHPDIADILTGDILIGDKVRGSSRLRLPVLPAQGRNIPVLA